MRILKEPTLGKNCIQTISLHCMMTDEKSEIFTQSRFSCEVETGFGGYCSAPTSGSVPPSRSSETSAMEGFPGDHVAPRLPGRGPWRCCFSGAEAQRGTDMLRSPASGMPMAWGHCPPLWVDLLCVSGPHHSAALLLLKASWQQLRNSH